MGAAPAQTVDGPRPVDRLRRFAERHAIWLVLIALFVVAAMLSEAFLRPIYIFNVVRQAAPGGIAAIGVTYVMILGGVDLSVERVTIAAYALAGALAGLALLARSGVSSTFAGRGLEFDVLAAIVLGGTTFQGGRGGIGGTIAGVFVLVVAFNLVNIVGLNYNAQLIVKGAIIIAASAAYVYVKRSH